MLFSGLAALIVALSVYAYLSGRVAVAGYTSIIASIWLLGSIIVFCVGIVGLNIGQLFQDTKGRPYYIIDERINEPAATAMSTHLGMTA
jgi:dolichol-phosphate mannosyltransferase